MHRLLLSLFLAATPMSSTSPTAPPGKDASKPLELLFIGNSYTYVNDLPEMLVAMAKAAGTRPLRYRMVTYGGATLAAHWGNGTGDAVKAIERHYDIVVLQEQSQMPLVATEVFQHFAREFESRIRASGARTFLYVTWARRDAPEDQEGLTAAYAAVARERQATLVPVGPVWQAVRKAMPDLQLHDGDGSHPSPLGSYIAALTFFAVLYDRSPEGLPAHLGQAKSLRLDLGADAAASLQKLVWETVRANKP